MSASGSTTPQSLIQNKELDDINLEGDELPSEAAVAAARRAASGDEGGGEGGSGGSDDAGDGEPVIRYSREELMEMKNLPLSKKKPDCLPTINSIITAWDSNAGKKRSETPNDDERLGRDGYGDKRRSNDPRERIRKESEGIVLSPQRRSFNSGCFVMGGGVLGGAGAGVGGPSGGGISVSSNPAAPVPGIAASVRLRPDSPILFADSRNGDSQKDGREVRRLGSGRLMSRDMWDRGTGASNGDDSMPGDYNSYRSSNHRNDDRYERRSYGRDMYGDKNSRNMDRERGMGMERDRDRDRGMDRIDRDRDRLMDRDRDRDRDMDSRYSDRRDRDDRRMNNRYMNKDYRKYEKEDEPEWFSGGPTSQHDTIELRGFDDVPSSSSTSSSNNNQASAEKLTTTTNATTSTSNNTNSNSNSSSNSNNATTSSKQQPATSAGSINNINSNSLNSSSQNESVTSSSSKAETTNNSTNTAGTTPAVGTTMPAATTAESQSGGVKVKQIRRSAGSGRTPSAVAANQNKDPPSIPKDFMNEEAMKKALSPVIGEDMKEDHKQSHLAPDLYLEEFLKMDNIPGLGLMSNGVPEEGPAGGSRFSKWFSRQSPPTIQQQRADSPDEHEHLLRNIMNDLEPSIHIPPVESPHLFAPISPAAASGTMTLGAGTNNNTNNNNMNNNGNNTSSNMMNHILQQQQQQQQQPNSLLEMLRRGHHQQNHQMHHGFQQQMKPTIDVPGKFQSVEELEARMRGAVIGQQQPPQPQQQHNPLHQQQHHQLQQIQQQQQQMRHNMQQQQPQQHRGPQDDEITAFKRLMAQVSGGHTAPTPNNNGSSVGAPKAGGGQPMSLLQMLNKSQQADQAALEAQQHQGGAVPHQDFLSKLLHVPHHQQAPRPIEPQQHPKIIPANHSNRHFQISPIPSDFQAYMNNLQPSRELLQRPEALAIVNGLKGGEITPQNLMQQITNPGTQNRHRDLLASILKLHQQQQQQALLSPRNRLVVPPQQPLRLSPLPPNAYCVSPIMATSPNTLTVHHPAIPQRIPSPRELQARTQSIMQSALIKKKLEEQLENYKKRQEMQQQATTPNTASPTKQHQSTIAFTPTSVLRNMTADKDSSGSDLQKQQQHGVKGPSLTPTPNPVAGWGSPGGIVMPQQAIPKHGRPIVKGGMGVPSYQPNPVEFPPHPQQHQFNNIQQQQQHQQQHFAAQMQLHMQQQQQQHHANRQQQMQHNLQPQQPQPPNSGGGPLRGMNPVHQMLMHQRSMNEGGDMMGPALSPTSNQLARWFTPELWAKANAGKLPSVNMATNMLSLEELERIQHSEAIVHN